MKLISKTYCSDLLLRSVVVLLLGNPWSLMSQPDAQENRNVLEVTWSNDFFYQTDRYFSNGFDLALYHKFMQQAPTRHLLFSLRGGQNHDALTLTHHLFTPDKQVSESVVLTDRPFASYLMVGHHRIAILPEKKLRLSTSLRIGILGKYSGGESIQNGIHALLPDSDEVIGWDNQLKTDLALDYTLKIEKGLLRKQYLDLIPFASVRAGIPYTDAAVGVRILAGNSMEYFNHIGLWSGKGVHFYFFAGISGRTVVYNAVLQGGLMNESPHTLDRVHPILSDIEAGVVFGIRNLTLEYSQQYRTPEYSGGMKHKWGAVTFRFAL